jgi:hypothetical protein
LTVVVASVSLWARWGLVLGRVSEVLGAGEPGAAERPVEQLSPGPRGRLVSVRPGRRCAF